MFGCALFYKGAHVPSAWLRGSMMLMYNRPTIGSTQLGWKSTTIRVALATYHRHGNTPVWIGYATEEDIKHQCIVFRDQLPAAGRCDVGCVHVLTWNTATFRVHYESKPANRGFRHELCWAEWIVENVTACLQHCAKTAFTTNRKQTPSLIHLDLNDFGAQ